MDFSSVEWKDKSKEAIELVKRMISHHEKRPFADEVLDDKWMFMSKIKNTSTDKVKVLYHNIKKYTKLDIFRKIILFFLVRNLSEEDISHYHSYYELFDCFHHGEINLKAFVKVVQKELKVDKDVAKTIF